MPTDQRPVDSHPTAPGAHSHGSLTSVNEFKERLWPAPWVWGAGPAMVGVLAVAYGAAYGAPLGWLIFIPLSVLAVLGVVVVSPTIQVSPDSLHVGRAVIPLRSLGQCRALDSGELTLETRRGDPTVFLALRTWATKTAVLVEVVDKADPHSAWLISTRHPHLLTDAITGSERSRDSPQN